MSAYRQRETTRRIEERRAERELFFWTAHECLRLIVRFALAVVLLAAVVAAVLGGDVTPSGLWNMFAERLG